MKSSDFEEALRCAYVAGILDGEGFIGATRRNPTPANKMVSPKYGVRVAVAMTDEGPVRAVADLIGAGHKVYLRDRRVKPHHSPVYIIDVESHRAFDLLQLTIPYLIGKKEQAERVCQLYNLKSVADQHLTKPGKSGPEFMGGRKANFSMSDEYLAQLDAIYRTIRRRPDR